METAVTSSQNLDLDNCSPKIEMNLMTLPYEIRRLIYHYFLKVDTEVDILEGERIIDLSLLKICRLFRGEALRYLLSSNIWTRLTYDHDRLELPPRLGCLTHIPTHLFTRKEREIIRCQAAVRIHVGASHSDEEFDVSEPQGDCLIFHTIGSYVEFPKALITISNAPNFQNLIKLTINLADRNQHILEDLLLVLTTVRGQLEVAKVEINGMQPPKLAIAVRNAMNGKNTEFRHYYEQMLALLEEGHKCFHKDCFRSAAAYYLMGLQMFESYLPGPVSTIKQPSAAQHTAIRSLGVDLACHYGEASRFITAYSRGADGLLLPQSIHHFAIMINLRYLGFIWCMNTDEQRAAAHYYDAFASETLAEYLSMPGYREYMLSYVDEDLLVFVDRRIDDLLEEATASYFYAWQANIHSPFADVRKESYVYLSYESGFYMWEDPKLVTVNGVRGYGGRPWIGDPLLVREWTLEKMKSGPLLGELNENYCETEKVLMALQHELGMRRGHTDGLLRILNLGATECNNANEQNQTTEHNETGRHEVSSQHEWINVHEIQN